MSETTTELTSDEEIQRLLDDVASGAVADFWTAKARLRVISQMQERNPEPFDPDKISVWDKPENQAAYRKLIAGLPE